MTEEHDGLDDYESGPYCQHWDDPGSCEEMCVCGHECKDHSAFEPHECEECDCQSFTELEKEPT